MNKSGNLTIGDDIKISFQGKLEDTFQIDGEDALSIRLENGRLVYSFKSFVEVASRWNSVWNAVGDFLWASVETSQQGNKKFKIEFEITTHRN